MSQPKSKASYKSKATGLACLALTGLAVATSPVSAFVDYSFPNETFTYKGREWTVPVQPKTAGYFGDYNPRVIGTAWTMTDKARSSRLGHGRGVRRLFGKVQVHLPRRPQDFSVSRRRSCVRTFPLLFSRLARTHNLAYSLFVAFALQPVYRPSPRHSANNQCKSHVLSNGDKDDARDRGVD